MNERFSMNSLVMESCQMFHIQRSALYPASSSSQSRHADEFAPRRVARPTVKHKSTYYRRVVFKVKRWTSNLIKTAYATRIYAIVLPAFTRRDGADQDEYKLKYLLEMVRLAFEKILLDAFVIFTTTILPFAAKRIFSTQNK